MMHRTSDAPLNPPPVIYEMAELAIKEVYANVDKMLLETIRGKLEGLLTQDEG